MGMGVGIIAGLLLDLLIGKTIGITAIMLGAVGIISGYLEKDFSKDSKITVMLMTMGITFAYEIILYLISTIRFGADLEMLIFLRRVGIEMVYNAILIIILYPLIQTAGNALEATFKERNTMTKYY